MKSAHQTTVHATGASATLSESRTPSSELLQQLSELVDGFLNLSTPFKYSSGNEQVPCEWTPLNITDRLVGATGLQHEFPDQSLIAR
jgi:hypothetical protein